MKTIALYLRLSNEDINEGESNSISNQRDLLRNYISIKKDLQGYEVLEFIDDGYSGATFDRPALNKLLKLTGKTIDVVLVKDFSRFGRNLIEVGNYIDQVFPFLGVRFIAVNEDYDSKDYKGSTASIDVGLKALIYEMYSRDISRKIRAVQKSKFQKGEYLCILPLYGYMRSEIEKNKLILNPETAPIVKRIFELACEGKTPTQIAVVFNSEGIPSPYMYHKEKGTDKMRGWKLSSENTIWTNAIVYRYLKDERYTGKLISRKRTKIDINTKKTMQIPRSEWIICEDAHEAIVSRDVWKQAQLVMRPYIPKPYTIADYNLFKGLLKCEHCGRTLTFFKNKKEPCYRCATRRFVTFCECKDIRINEKKLKNFVLSEIQRKVRLFILEDIKNGKIENNSFQAEIERIEKQMKQVDCKKTLLFENLADCKLSKEDFKQSTAELSHKKIALDKEKMELLQNLNSTYVVEDNVPKDLGKYSGVQELTQQLVAELIQRIKVFPDNSLEIVWNFKDSINY
ncbi:MAG: recombinase family protein [Anaerotignum sp.]|nr:recombinase family protein [Anaerotignum sp.]